MTDDTTKVWYLIGTLAVGGTERTLVDLISGLDREQFKPVIWTISEPGPLADEVPDDVKVHSLGAAHKLDFRTVVRFALTVRRTRPDILQSFLFFDNILARLAGIVSPSTTVITGVREVPTDPSTLRTIVDRLTQPLSDLVVSNSKAGAEYVVERGVPERKVQVVRNGRNIEQFASAKEPADLRQSIGIPDDGTVVGSVGRLVVRKGHYDLLDAWSEVVSAHPRAHLVIAGDGPEYDGLTETATQHHIKDSVHLIGCRDDIPELLDLFDVFVLPSHYEGLPGALLEAMAAGLPIVTTPVDGNNELVSDGKHGIHVTADRPHEIAKALNMLLTESSYAICLGENAQDRARDRFTTERMVSSFEDLYRR